MWAEKYVGFIACEALKYMEYEHRRVRKAAARLRQERHCGLSNGVGSTITISIRKNDIFYMRNSEDML